MDNRLKRSEEECIEDIRQYGCLRKYEKIVNQFDELMEMMDSITQSRKRRRISRKKSTSGGVAINNPAPTTDEEAKSHAEVGEGGSSTVSSTSQEEKTAALEKLIMNHLSDLQSDQPSN